MEKILQFFAWNIWINLIQIHQSAFYNDNNLFYLLNAPSTMNTQSSLVLSVQNTTGNNAEKTVPTRTPFTGATPLRIICHGWICKIWILKRTNYKCRKIAPFTPILGISIYSKNKLSNSYQFSDGTHWPSNDAAKSYSPIRQKQPHKNYQSRNWIINKCRLYKVTIIDI